MALFRTAYFYIAMVIDLLIMAARYNSLKARQAYIPKKEYETLVAQRVRNFAKRQMRNTGATINLVGAENIPDDGGVLFVSNHQSYFDTGIFLGYIETNLGFIAKIEMKKAPVIRKYMSEIHCVFLDRGNMRQSMKAILEGIGILENNHSLVIFPEGTRNTTMDKFKAGSFKLATKAKVPIVPITIDGTSKILEKGKKLIRPAVVNITVHPPIATTDLTKEEEQNLHITVHKIIADQL
ncbi:MAG: 1-acyl-sn-glycerol-3-phosphate acyltransferase [Defluviitaleaceae bacterium]|nr:1-acyl-sn-glycerol-3-phosphate acyltransferase [Defluviitaleaceae bacterium]